MSAARNRTTDNVLANSKAILDIVSAAPVPILGPVLSAATKVLAEVEAARALKESCIILATRATSIVYSIYVAVMNQTPPSTISELNIISLSETLHDIANLMRRLSRISWFMFILKRFSIRQQIDLQTARLEDTFKCFQIQETLHISSVLQSFSQRFQAIQDSEVIPSSQIEDDIDMNARGFKYGTLVRGRYNNKVIICKRYHYDDEDSLKEFIREKATWMVLRHPGIVRYLGCSPAGHPHPYVVLSAQHGNAAMIFRQRLQQQSVELDEFAKVSNFMVDQQGSPVLGCNIVMKAPEKGRPRKDQLDRLLGLFYMLVEQLLFDDQPVFPFECWKGLQHFMYIRPRQAWSARVFDIGYVRQEQFIPLVNIQDAYNPDTLAIIEDQAILTLPSVQDDDIVALPGNVTRYTFRNTDNASIQRRLNGRMLSDSAGAVQLLLQFAPKVIREYGEGHDNLRPSDLILVCGSIDHPSGAGITFRETPPHEFYFYELPAESEPWGIWSLSGDLNGQTLDATSITSNVQSISFVQLEGEDFDV
ncbi:hypothetical protein EYR40_005928 [Pleurotus pulmonarius]|nr:hypothetical protein EYR40_005928 [Pleurotus pulmonarius]